MADITPTAARILGETWKVTIGAAQYAHVVQADANGAPESLAAILASLAAKINTGVVTDVRNNNEKVLEASRDIKARLDGMARRRAR